MKPGSSEGLDMALAAVDSAACLSFREHAALLVTYANQQVTTRADIHALLGSCLLDVLYRNHADHVQMMAAQLELQSAEAMIMSFTWICRRNHTYGISTDLFPILMDIWGAALLRYLPPAAAAQIGAVYRALRELHPTLVAAAQLPEVQPSINEALRPHIDRYLHALLVPDARAALQAAEAFIQNTDQISTWWEYVIKPTMYEIGQRWAQGEISIGQEHIATAITQRVMSHYYPQILDIPRQKGHVVVSASPGELHEIGSRILADILELNGWDTYYTGANTPSEAIIDLLNQNQAQFLCISTTLTESLPEVAKLISEVRSANLRVNPTIIVGGQAYQSAPGLWKQVGADWFAPSAHAGISFIESAQP